LRSRRRFLLRFYLKPIIVCLDVDSLIEIPAWPVDSIDTIPSEGKRGTFTGDDDKDTLDPTAWYPPTSQSNIRAEKAWESIGLHWIVPLQIGPQDVSFSR
jgi:hypothetical protein